MQMTSGLLSICYRNEDERGKYNSIMLTAESLADGGYEYEYKGHIRI